MALYRVLLVVVALWGQAGPVRGSSSGVTICSCDLSPGNCDLNCCCDPDCNLSTPTSVFSSCVPGSTKAERLVCLYSWLIFRNNTPYTTTLVGSPPTQLFCVLSADAALNYFVTPQTVNALNFQSISEPYKGPSFSAASQSVPVFSSFYKAGDPVLTLSASSALNVLRQPAPVGAQNLCSDNSPTKFLVSGSTVCLRVFSNLTDSCETDLSLDPSFYYQDIAVLRVPAGVSGQGARTVPITSPVTDKPVLLGDQCNNVVSQPITSAAGRSVQTRSGNPGYLTGYPVLSNNGNLLLLRSLVGESCSYSPVQFGINTLSGCTIRGTAQDSCSSFQARAYQIMLGGNAPQSLAIYGNVTAAQSGHWTQIIYKNCSSQGTCSSGCLIPVLLNMQIMWAQVGLISNPQAQLLGARFLYTCQSVKCQDTTVLQTQVSFSDLSKRGPTPRASPGITDRDPVDFFFPFQTNTAVTNPRSLLLYSALYCWLIMQLVRIV